MDLEIFGMRHVLSTKFLSEKQILDAAVGLFDADHTTLEYPEIITALANNLPLRGDIDSALIVFSGGFTNALEKRGVTLWQTGVAPEKFDKQGIYTMGFKKTSG